MKYVLLLSMLAGALVMVSSMRAPVEDDLSDLVGLAGAVVFAVSLGFLLIL